MKEQDVEITNSILFEFQRYVRGEMTKREEFTFQKNIRKDQYADAAIVGFADVPEEEIPFFTNFAEEEEEKRIKSKKRLIYSIIASVIILLIATSAYLVAEKKLSVKQFKPFRFLHSSLPAAPVVLPVIKDNQQIAAFQQAESMASLAIPDIRTLPPPPEIIPDPEILPLAGDSFSGDNSELLATDNVTDSSAIQDQTVLTARAGSGDSPDIIAGSTAAGEESAGQAGNDQGGYIAPQPVNGDNSFSKYIEENIRKPQTLPEGENAVAVVSFVVKTSGDVDGIKVLSSPGEEYTAEAIRLIREGPAWKPAENNGMAVEDQKMLRIVFK
ncbi:MAG TPA: energy transducer TonB [Bacteroidales bacterium]|jgi:hypothetical protein|nr:energy transducer TonB [Bacteroidales bacterium]HQH23953.1 energy transducer TonB [Bacteroidales bacterium]HQJ81283.1 energy transducer TonB [Bacteroidales bacterium]